MNIFKVYTNFSIPNNYQYTAKGQRLNTPVCDTVSFSGKRNLVAEMKNLPVDAFPSDGLRCHMLKEIEENEANIVDIHKSYYSKLQDCKTLDEAKEIYPELENVVDAKDIDISKIKGKSVIKNVANGKAEDATIDTFSLELLKRYYGNLLPTCRKENYYGLSTSTAAVALDTLNIKMDKRYFAIINEQMRINAMKSSWQTQERKDKQTAAMQKFLNEHPERKYEFGQQSKKRWDDPETRAKMCMKIQEACQTEEYRKGASMRASELWKREGHRENMSEKMKECWQNPEFRENVVKLQREKWQDPEFREFMSQERAQRWANPEYKAKTLASMLKVMQTEEYKQKQSVSTKRRWEENEEYQSIMKLVSLARKKSWDIHPYGRQAYSEIASEFPEIGPIIEKVKHHKQLTPTETSIRNSFFSACDERYPNLKKEIGEIQKELLRDWGFYDENRNTETLIGILNSLEETDGM